MKRLTNKFTKIVTLTLMVVMLLSVVMPMAVAWQLSTSVPFTDTRNHWAAHNIGWAYANNITSGTSAATFHPNRDVTRAMFATFLYRVAGEPGVSGMPALAFADNAAIRQLDWAEGAIRWAAGTDVTTGFPTDNTFRPRSNIQRQQIATMLFRYARSIGLDTRAPAGALAGFPDSGHVAGWAAEEMRWAVHHGIITGLRGNLAPANNATRAETVTMLYRFVSIFNLPTPPRSTEVRVFVNNRQIEFRSQQPTIVNNTPLVPLTEISRAIGLSYGLYDDYSRIKIGYESQSAILDINSTTAYASTDDTGWNFETVRMSQGPVLREGTPFIPILYLERIFGIEMRWNEASRTVIIDNVEGEKERRERFYAHVSQNMERFNMSLQYTSENFYFYAGDERADEIPIVAARLENRLIEIEEAFGETLPQRVSVFIFTNRDYTALINEGGSVFPHHDYGGHNNTALRDFMMKAVTGYYGVINSDWTFGCLVHYLVHLFQQALPVWGDMPSCVGWISEGAATHFEDYGYHKGPGVLNHMIRQRGIPSLNYLIYEFTGCNYKYIWAASIMEFVVDNWGLTYIGELHRRPNDFQGIFGISRAEFERQWHQWLRENYG